jgi:angio-associated migratory cell protein
VAFSSDGNLLACGSFDGQINVWNTAARALKGTLEGSGSGFEVRFSDLIQLNLFPS